MLSRFKKDRNLKENKITKINAEKFEKTIYSLGIC
jgi:hypothetical protein